MITQSEFDAINAEYREKFSVPLICVDTQGHVLFGSPLCGELVSQPECVECHRRTVQEGLRWGAPSINSCHCGYALWAVPLMDNSRVYGGLVAAGVPLGDNPPGKTMSSKQIREASEALRVLAEAMNLTNAAFLHQNRMDLGRETERAEAIHLCKISPYDSIREIYLREEPALLAAVKRGERKEARRILNRVLVGIYHFSGERMDLLKSILLELVVMLYRAAVETGADPTALLGRNYRSITELARIQDERELTDWLTRMLERQMDAIHNHRIYPNTVLLGKALAYMREHIAEELNRTAVARNSGLSSSHFSRLIKEKLGRTFTDLLRQYRVDHAKRLLLRTGKSLAEIAYESGFSDQSYFTKVFQRYAGATPGDYRRQDPGRDPDSA